MTVKIIAMTIYNDVILSEGVTPEVELLAVTWRCQVRIPLSYGA